MYANECKWMPVANIIFIVKESIRYSMHCTEEVLERWLALLRTAPRRYTDGQKGQLRQLSFKQVLFDWWLMIDDSWLISCTCDETMID